jgi:molecular chaperone DnaJ
MSKKDFYELLGVSKSASADELKKAYRKLAMQYHPDKNPGDAAAEAKFKEISEAYDVLKDEQKRAAYDRYGHAAFESGMGGGRGGGGFSGFNNHAGFDARDFADMFSDLFGADFGGARRGGASQQRTRGSDLQYNIAVTLEEAYHGKQEKIRFKTQVKCDDCEGSGSADGKEMKTCPGCQGSGRMRAQQGFFTIERTCSQCQGMGKIIENPCLSCSGQGRVRKDRTISVNIPAGVEEGTRIRVASEGEMGLRGGPAGDLYIFVSIVPHKFFIREGNDLHCEVPIKMTTAALGGSLEVPVIDGTKAKVTIPEGTQPGQKFRLKGKGMSILQAGTRRGDMYIHVSIEVPVKLDEKQRELLTKLDNSLTQTSQPKSSGFMDRVKDFLDEFRSS